MYFKKRFYARQELAVIFAIDAKDKNFKRKIITRLANLGYSVNDYEYTSKGVTFKWEPTTADEKIKFLLTQFGVNKQVDYDILERHLYLLLQNENEESDIYKFMPWNQRAKYLEKNYGFNVKAATLQKWTEFFELKNLIKYDKGGDNNKIWFTKVLWQGKTKCIKRGILNDINDKYYQEYLEFRKEKLIETNYDWVETGAALWEKFHCRFYTYYTYVVNEFVKEDMNELLKQLNIKFYDNEFSKAYEESLDKLKFEENKVVTNAFDSNLISEKDTAMKRMQWAAEATGKSVDEILENLGIKEKDEITRILRKQNTVKKVSVSIAA